MLNYFFERAHGRSTLTQTSIDVVAKAQQHVDDQITFIPERMNEQDLRELIRLLGTLADNLEVISQEEKEAGCTC